MSTAGAVKAARAQKDAARGQCTECLSPARGSVPEEGVFLESEAEWFRVPAHQCRQCAEHCQIAAYIDLGRRTTAVTA